MGELISHLPKLYNQTQRRDMHRIPFTIREFHEVLYKLQPGKAPGVDGLPAEIYCRLPLNLKRHLAAHLWDIAIRENARTARTWYTRCMRRATGRTQTPEDP